MLLRHSLLAGFFLSLLIAAPSSAQSGCPATFRFDALESSSADNVAQGLVFVQQDWDGTALVNDTRREYVASEGGTAGTLLFSRWSDGDGSGWPTPVEAETFAFDDQGRMLEHVYMASGGGPYQRDTLGYGASPYPTYEAREDWTGSGWGPNRRYAYDYTEAGTLAGYLFERYASGWATDIVFESDLDAAGNRILCRFRTEPGATPYRLTTSTFDGDGRRTSVVTRNYDETAGAYVEADSTAMAYGPYGIVLHEAFDRDGSTWKLVERHTVTYSNEGSRAVAVQELPRSVGSGLVARVRKTLDLDPFSRPTSYLQEVYPDGASDWQPSVRYLYTYAADPRQTDVALDPTTDAFALSVAPNPSAGVFSVTLTASSPTTVEVFDALGRRVAEVRSGSVASGETRIPVDLRSLPAGVYVLRATTEAGGVVSRTATVVR